MEGSTDDNTGLRVASFSCYLDATKENSLHTKFVIQDSTPFTFAQQPRKHGEIGIFGADKYFNMNLDCPHYNNQTRIGSNPGPTTPSSGTWNTQTALLPILHRNGSQIKHKKLIGRRIFSGFGCIQPCFNRKDVHLPYYGSKPAPTESVTVKKLEEEEEGRDQFANIENPRSSMEVLGSKTTLEEEVAKNMERKLSTLTWDAIPKAQNQRPTSTVGSGTVACDDMASEASSDLFEIDTISVSHYAPSESSVAWSAADNYPASEVTAGDVAVSQTNGNGSNYYRSCKSRSGGLLSCKSLKAVEVVSGKGKHQGLDLSVKSQKHLRF